MSTLLALARPVFLERQERVIVSLTMGPFANSVPGFYFGR